jgi:hypothetical protein
MLRSVRQRCKNREKRNDKHTHGGLPNDAPISYRMLLEELNRRVASGWHPENREYFADLVFNLLINQCAAERVARGSAQRN